MSDFSVTKEKLNFYIGECVVARKMDFNEPLVGDYRGVVCAIIPTCSKESEERALQLAKGYQLVVDGGLERLLQVCYDLISRAPAKTVAEVDGVDFVMDLAIEQLAP